MGGAVGGARGSLRFPWEGTGEAASAGSGWTSSNGLSCSVGGGESGNRGRKHGGAAAPVAVALPGRSPHWLRMLLDIRVLIFVFLLT